MCCSVPYSFSHHGPVQEFGLQLRAEDIASIYTYANVDEDLVLDREEWRNKFDIPDPMPVKIRMWKCKSERCTTTEEGFDEWTQLPNEYPEELKFCPVCGDPQVLVEIYICKHLKTCMMVHMLNSLTYP